MTISSQSDCIYEQINEAIAEACGIISKDQWGSLYRTLHGIVRNCPDYCNDLNAMHEAEKAVFRSSNLWQKFVFELIETSGGSGMCELDGLCCLAQSAARQRAEAFLRTLGKWEEA